MKLDYKKLSKVFRHLKRMECHIQQEILSYLDAVGEASVEKVRISAKLKYHCEASTRLNRLKQLGIVFTEDPVGDTRYYKINYDRVSQVAKAISDFNSGYWEGVQTEAKKYDYST